MQRARTIEEYYIEREAQSDREYRVRIAGIPEAFRSKSWDDYADDARSGDETVKDILMYYGETWEPSDRESIVLLGKPGRGKTMGMSLLAMDLIDAGCWVRWTSYADLTNSKKMLIRLSQEAERINDWGDHEKLEMKLRWITTDCQALFLDDVGKEFRSSTGWADSELDLLVRSRQAAGKLTFMTSNISRTDWAQYNESMSSFLMEMGEVIEITEGRDFRAQVPEKRAQRRARR